MGATRRTFRKYRRKTRKMRRKYKRRRRTQGRGGGGRGRDSRQQARRSRGRQQQYRRDDKASRKLRRQQQQQQRKIDQRQQQWIDYMGFKLSPAKVKYLKGLGQAKRVPNSDAIFWKLNKVQRNKLKWKKITGEELYADSQEAKRTLSKGGGGTDTIREWGELSPQERALWADKAGAANKKAILVGTKKGFKVVANTAVMSYIMLLWLAGQSGMKELGKHIKKVRGVIEHGPPEGVAGHNPAASAAAHGEAIKMGAAVGRREEAARAIAMAATKAREAGEPASNVLNNPDIPRDLVGDVWAVCPANFQSNQECGRPDMPQIEDAGELGQVLSIAGELGGTVDEDAEIDFTDKDITIHPLQHEIGADIRQDQEKIAKGEFQRDPANFIRPIVARQGNKIAIIDGHHRIVGQALLGRQPVPSVGPLQGPVGGQSKVPAFAIAAPKGAVHAAARAAGMGVIPIEDVKVIQIDVPESAGPLKNWVADFFATLRENAPQIFRGKQISGGRMRRRSNSTANRNRHTTIIHRSNR